MWDLKKALLSFVSRKLFFSMFIFISICIMLERGRMSDGVFETISMTIITVYLTSNVASGFTFGKGSFSSTMNGRRSHDEPEDIPEASEGEEWANTDAEAEINDIQPLMKQPMRQRRGKRR